MLFSPIFSPPAYLDPGSGSIIIQLTIAAILGLGVLVRSQWSRIKKLFGKKNTDTNTDTDDTDSEE
jgi:hypothetical protein